MTARLRGGARPPEAPYPVLPLRTGVVFPGAHTTLNIGRSRSMALASELRPGDVIAVVSQKDPNLLEPSLGDLYNVGVFARVVSLGAARGARQVTLEGLGRMSLTSLTQVDPFWRGMGPALEERQADTEETGLLAQALRERVREVQGSSGGALEAADDDDPALLADRVAAGLLLDTSHAAELLATLEVPVRLRRVLELLAEAKTLSDLKSKIDRDVRAHFGKQQREAILRQQLDAIKKELGEGPDVESDLSALRKRLEAAGLPEEAREGADRELKRLESMGQQGPEANVIRTYLDWLAAMPWQKRAESRTDLDAIASKLDADHHGLADVKKRILEHMAVYKLAGNPRGTILCLVGPPGVGKTSLGQSVADATGRPFMRISLGGVRDEAEIRGHRRTYVGALPGRLVSAMRKVGVKNPVVLLDEIDKLGHGGYGGWPEAALLEVLDPEQNRTFTDHYLETPFDLSEVLFICTANTLDTLSPPLRDRLEIVELSGYTLPEKAHIARRHLLPRRLTEHGVPESSLVLTPPALETIISGYTREAGVRQLDRELTRVVRAVALRVARATEDAPARAIVDVEHLRELLGRPRFFDEVAERTAVPGVATGLAWTPVGGGILFIETSRMAGKGRLEITGQLGDVMKESARAALTYVRSHAAELGVDPESLDRTDLHIHVPAGAVPKDGPSAGVTIFTALVSLLTGRRTRPDTAMTGEVTLRGRVLPVGGITAKVLAAHRAGIRRVLLPQKNERDLDDIPKEVQDELEIILVSDMASVLASALEDEPAPLSPSVAVTAEPAPEGTLTLS